MSRALVTAALFVSLTASGCVREYRSPKPNEPHATLKVRRTFRTKAGVYLREGLRIDDQIALRHTAKSETADAPGMDTLLAHPGTAELSSEATFFHVEVRTFQENYTVQVPYSTTESYSCGSYNSYQTCTRMVTRYRSETRSHWVTRPVEVVDAACGAGVWANLRVNGNYLMQFDYSEHGVCRTACYEQSPGVEAGTFDNRPCDVPTKEQVRRSLSDR